MVFIQSKILSNHKEESNPVICGKMNATGGIYVNSNKPETGRQLLLILSYMWKLKKVFNLNVK
jgi:hypothetical protein